MADNSPEAQAHTEKTIHALWTRMRDVGLLNDDQYQSLLFKRIAPDQALMIGLVNFAIMNIDYLKKPSGQDHPNQEHQPRLHQDKPAQPVSKEELDAVPEANPPPLKAWPAGKPIHPAPQKKGD